MEVSSSATVDSSPASGRAFFPVWHAVVGGAMLMLTQVVCAVLLSSIEKGSAQQAYLDLGTWWDSNWYRSIIERGYDATPGGSGVPLNTVFFPGYPFLAGMVSRMLGVPAVVGMLVVAQGAAWAFWTYILLFLRCWRVPLAVSLIGILILLFHPSAFFLVAGYSESLFLASLLGFLYWAMKEGRSAWMLAAAHGFLMTATRMTGLPLVVFPILYVLLHAMAGRGSIFSRRMLSAVALSAVASLGAVLFLAYCAFLFGRWDGYVTVATANWWFPKDLWNIVRLRSYRAYLPPSVLLTGLADDPTAVSIGFMPYVSFAFLAGVVQEFFLHRTGKAEGWWVRVSLLIGAYLLLMPSLVKGEVGKNGVFVVASFIRYALPVHVLLVLALQEGWARFPRPRASVRAFLVVLLLVFLTFFAYVQGFLLFRFTHNLWVA